MNRPRIDLGDDSSDLFIGTMMKKGKCPKCSSNRVLPDLPVVDRDQGEARQSLAIMISEKPRALFLTRPKTYPLRAWVCSACGYTELYTDQPQELAKSYKKALAHMARKK
jgi:predicted nucleic-acid-binding Zn-ribbon protein